MFLRKIKLWVLAGLLFSLFSLPIAAASLPNFSSKDLGSSTEVQEKPFEFQSQHLSKPTVFIFWASWCKPCVFEVPDAITLFQEVSAKIDVIGVSVDKDSRKALEFIAKYKIPYKNLHDPEMNIADLMGITATPALVLIDKKGSVVYRSIHIDEKLKSHIQKIVP